MQNKSVLALIWKLYEESVSLQKKSKTLFINTFYQHIFSNKRFLERHESYVSKPVFGREGGGVSIYENDELLAEDKQSITLNKGRYTSNT